MTSKEAPVKDAPQGLSRWELAVYIGVPVAALCLVGGAYYYCLSKDKSGEEDTPDGKKNKTKKDQSEVETVPEKEQAPAEKAQAAKLKGNKYFKGGKFDSAIKCYTEAIEICPSDKVEEISTYYQNRAAAHEQLKNWQNVVEDASKAIDLKPKYTKALARRARAYENLGQKRECLEDVTAVCLLEGFQNQECLLLADRILKALGKDLAKEHALKRQPVLPSPTFISSYLDSFSQDLFTVEPAEGEENDPYCKAVNEMKQKQFDNVIGLSSEEIEKDGKYKAKALLLRGTMYTLMSAIDKAVADFDELLKFEDNEENSKLKINALIKRGSLKMQQGKDKECLDDFESAIKINDNVTDIYHHRGQIHFLTDKLEDARKDFQRAMILDENFVPPRLQMGYCLCKIAMQMFSPVMMQEANRLLEETTKKFPNAAEAWSLFGQLLQDQQKFDEAEEKLNKAIELHPTNPTTYVYKALLMLQWKQDVEQARKLIQEAIEHDSKCDFAYETLATLEVQRGNMTEAVELFEKAIDLVRTESEMAHTFSLLEAAKAQGKVTQRLGIKAPFNTVM